MNLFILDAGGAFFYAGGLVVAMIIIIFLEAIVMLLFKLNKFGKCILDSFIVNIASLIIGYLLLSVLGRAASGTTDYRNATLFKWTVFLAVTVVIEGYGLIFLNK